MSDRRERRRKNKLKVNQLNSECKSHLSLLWHEEMIGMNELQILLCSLAHVC